MSTLDKWLEEFMAMSQFRKFLEKNADQAFLRAQALQTLERVAL